MYKVWIGVAAFLFGIGILVPSALTKDGERIPLVSEHPSDPAVAKLFDEIRAKGQQVINLYRMDANSPAIFIAHQEYGQKLRYAAKVPRKYRELVILRTTQVENGRYEYVHHIPLALGCGVSQAQIDALPHWRESNAFDPQERAVLAFSDGMSTREGPDDATFRVLASFFGNQEIVELAMTDGFYMAGSRIGTALGLQLESNGGASSTPHGC